MPGPAAAVSAAEAGRLDGIETQIRALAAQLEQLQEQVRALAAGAGAMPQAANEPPGPRRGPGRPQFDAGPPQPNGPASARSRCLPMPRRTKSTAS